MHDTDSLPVATPNAKENPIRRAVEAWIRAEALSGASVVENDPLNVTFRFGCTSNAAHYEAFLDVDDEDQLLDINIYFPVVVPPARDAEASRLIMRRNSRNAFGAFEYAGRERRLRYRAAMILGGDTAKPEIIDRMFGTGFRLMEELLPELMAIIYAGANADDLLAVRGGSGRDVLN